MRGRAAAIKTLPPAQPVYLMVAARPVVIGLAGHDQKMAGYVRSNRPDREAALRSLIRQFVVHGVIFSSSEEGAFMRFSTTGFRRPNGTLMGDSPFSGRESAGFSAAPRSHGLAAESTRTLDMEPPAAAPPPRDDLHDAGGDDASRRAESAMSNNDREMLTAVRRHLERQIRWTWVSIVIGVVLGMGAFVVGAPHPIERWPLLVTALVEIVFIPWWTARACVTPRRILELIRFDADVGSVGQAVGRVRRVFGIWRVVEDARTGTPRLGLARQLRLAAIDPGSTIVFRFARRSGVVLSVEARRIDSKADPRGSSMSDRLDRFDPNRKWLGIPPAKQPPNHNRCSASSQCMLEGRMKKTERGYFTPENNGGTIPIISVGVFRAQPEARSPCMILPRHVPQSSRQCSRATTRRRGNQPGNRSLIGTNAGSCEFADGGWGGAMLGTRRTLRTRCYRISSRTSDSTGPSPARGFISGC